MQYYKSGFCQSLLIFYRLYKTYNNNRLVMKKPFYTVYMPALGPIYLVNLDHDFSRVHF